MLGILVSFFAPMLSLFLLAVGAGLLTTTQAVWLEQNHYSAMMIAINSAAFYMGFVYSAFHCEKTIRKIYHI